MSSTVVPKEYDITVNPTAALALAANPARAYLQIFNKSAGKVTYKFGPFIPAASAVQVIAFSAVPTAGTWTATILGQTASFNYNDNAATIQTGLQTLTNVGANNITVSGDYTVGFTVTFAGNLGNIQQAAIVVNPAGLSNNLVQSSAVQAINFDQPPTAGNITLGFKGQNTPSLPFDVSAGALQTALNALDTMSPTGVSALAQDGTTKDFSVTMGGAPLLDAAQPLIQVVVSTLTGTVAQATQSVTLQATPKPIAGTFQLSNGTDTTLPMQWNADAGTIQNFLAVLPSIGVGNVAVTGSWAAGFTIIYQGTLVNSKQPVIFLTNKLLVGDTLNDDDETTGLDDIDYDSVKWAVVVNTLGHGADTVAVTVATTAAGAVPGPVTASVVVNVAGTPGESGVDILAAAEPVLMDAEVPIDAIYMESALSNSAVVILEG